MTERLTAYEWEDIAVSPAREDRLHALAKRYAARIGWPENAILSRTHKGLKAGQVVGVLSIPGLTLEILPKIDRNDGDVRVALIRMLAVAWDLRVVDGDFAALDTQRTDLLELLVRLFAERLHAATRRGLPRHYVTHEGDLKLLRGKLVVSRQVTALAARRDLLSCQFDELSVDAPLNRVLKAAVRRLISPDRSPANARLLSNLAASFEMVEDVSDPLKERVRLDRTNRSFHELYELAKLFLRGDSQSTTSGRSTGLALLFKMNDLFEGFVGRCLTRALAPSRLVRLQHSRHHALVDSNDQPFFALKPDIVVDPEGAPIIIDTKWKLLDQGEPTLGVTQSDVYQLMAYSQAYRSDRTVLAYPWHPDIGAPPGLYQRWKISGTDRALEVATVNVGQPETVVEQLRAILGADCRQSARSVA